MMKTYNNELTVALEATKLAHEIILEIYSTAGNYIYEGRRI